MHVLDRNHQVSSDTTLLSAFEKVDPGQVNTASEMCVRQNNRAGSLRASISPGNDYIIMNVKFANASSLVRNRRRKWLQMHR